MTSTMSFSFGDVVLVPFPFTDQSATKRKPVIATLEQTLILRRLGALGGSDCDTLRAALGVILETGPPPLP